MSAIKPSGPQYLRADAEELLRAGTAPPSAGWTVGAEALSLLYRLASDPERSGDAQKLLHELQTHQVELDLQHAQLADNEGDLAQQLAHFECLYDHAPAGYLVLGLDGRILRSNRFARDFFGMDAGPLEGRLLTSLVSSEEAPVILAAVEKAATVNAIETVRTQTQGSGPLRIDLGMAPAKDAVLALLLPESRPAGN